ncbi:hypothetical protein Tco_0327049 [Tanacetum coccineum]
MPPVLEKKNEKRDAGVKNDILTHSQRTEEEKICTVKGEIRKKNLIHMLGKDNGDPQRNSAKILIPHNKRVLGLHSWSSWNTSKKADEQKRWNTAGLVKTIRIKNHKQWLSSEVVLMPPRLTIDNLHEDPHIFTIKRLFVEETYEF